MRTFQLCFSAIAAIGLLSACGGSDDKPDDGPPYVLNVKKVEGRYHNNKSAPATDLKSAPEFVAHQAATIELPALNTEELILKSSGIGGALQVAQAQQVPQAKTAAELAQLLTWNTDAQGNSSASLQVHAADAYGLRLGLVVDALPDSATVRVFKEADGQQEAVGYETSGADINSLIQTNVQAGESGQAGHTWWSADLGGDTVVLQISLPAGVTSDAVKVALPIVSNVFRDVSDYAFEPYESAPAADEAQQSLVFGNLNAKAGNIPSAGTCNLDVTCFDNGAQQRDAVARMLYVGANGNGFFCTGTLLNDAIQSNTPYFLTANHCISTHAEASSLQTDWFFRSASCNSSLLNSKSTKRTGGARLLFTNNSNQGNDMTLLVLNNPAPAGTYLAGWDANQNNYAQDVYGIHQPMGSLAKISGGKAVAYANCTGTSCVEANDRGRFYGVLWSEGVTEGGSSGSALFTRNNYVIGTLFAGSSSCSAPFAPDFYGRFDQAFESGIKNFLASSKVPF